MTLATVYGGYLYQWLHLLGVSKDQAQHVQDLFARPIAVVLIAIATVVVSGVGSHLIRRGLGRIRRSLTSNADPGHSSRVDTVLRIVANAWRVTIDIIGLITVLAVIGIDLAPLLAGATVIGATIGFGAQSLVRDFLSGLLMLMEDQYRIGDLVTVNDITGTVEEVSLRVTRIRTADGTAWYIPNGQILRLGNSSRHWSRALVSVAVALGVPIPEATKAIEEAATEALERPELAGKCRSGPRVLGVSSVTSSQVTIDVEVQTAPLAADEVARVLREAIVERLARDRMLPVPTT